MDDSKNLASYLKSKQGLNRLMLKLKYKYQSLEKYSGVVIIDNISHQESIDLSNLLGKKVEVSSNIKISYSKLEKILKQTKYESFNWQDLFKFYFEMEIKSNKQMKESQVLSFDMFLQEVIDNNKNKDCVLLIEDILKDKNDLYNVFRRHYKKDKNKLEKDLKYILLLLDNIPNKPTNLAVYASLTGNPHYLDLNTSSSNLFLRILAHIKNVDYIDKTVDKKNLFALINVYIDPISNFVITYKIIGNEILVILDKKDMIINLNLEKIININYLDTKEKKVYIFENPSILNALKDLKVPMIITSGIPNLAVYKVLEKLSDSGNELYYNGDFDPEGLMIADKLKNKFPNLNLFCYAVEDFKNAISNEVVNGSRIKKLDNIINKELIAIKESIKKSNKSAYQEKNLDRIRKYILDNK